jgi:IS1 family transposase
MVIMNRLSTNERAQIVRCLVEGNSINSTVRMTGFAKNTILKLLRELGATCDRYQNLTLVNLQSTRIEADEIWSFCHSKEKNVPEEKRGELGFGDVWTWVAFDPDTKLVATWLVGRRDGPDAMMFLIDLARRLANRVQLTTDGHKPYIEAVEAAFGKDIDYAMLIKQYGIDDNGAASPTARRYSPNKVTSEETVVITGSPAGDLVSTSGIERQNLTMRMGMRRFTRLTNAFSKKVENLTAAVALHYMHYNFGRPHKSLGKNVTPAMAAGITDHVWTCEEIAALLD